MKKQALLFVAVLVGALVMIDHAVAQRPDGGGRGRGNRGERQRPERPEPPQGGPGFGEGGERGFGGPGGPGGGGPGEMMRRLPMMSALDANDDGEISAEEIANAVQALKSLDKNSDGKLTLEELRPDGGAWRIWSTTRRSWSRSRRWPSPAKIRPSPTRPESNGGTDDGLRYKRRRATYRRRSTRTDARDDEECRQER